MELHLRTLLDTTEFGRKVGSLLHPGDVVALNGPLGVGKTALVGGVASGMGVDPGYSVTSPTFVFAHIYEGKIPLYHVDLYRVERTAELAGIGLDDMLGGDGVAVVEWFDRFPAVWPGERLVVDMTFFEKTGRRAIVTGFGPRGLYLAKSLAEAE